MNKNLNDGVTETELFANNVICMARIGALESMIKPFDSIEGISKEDIKQVEAAVKAKVHKNPAIAKKMIYSLGLQFLLIMFNEDTSGVEPIDPLTRKLVEVIAENNAKNWR